MLVRAATGIVLAALFAVGCYLLWLGVALHYHADASESPGMVFRRLLWLVYLAMLDLLWGTSAVAMLWPGRRSEQLKRVLGYGAFSAVISGAVLMGVAYMPGQARFYIELAGLVLASGFVVLFGQAWLSRQSTD